MGWLACALALAVPGAALVATAGGPDGAASYAATSVPPAGPAVKPAAKPAVEREVEPAVAPAPEAPAAIGTIAAPARPARQAPAGFAPAAERPSERVTIRVNPAVLAVAADPVRVRVPRLGIAAELDPLALDRALELIAPEYGRAGWYQRGPEPGEAGRAVIAGHLDSRTGPDVFYDLRNARRGDRIVVDLADGGRVVYRVQRVGVFAKDRFPTESVYGGPRILSELRLITCGGAYVRSAGGYQDNVVVFAVRV